MNSIFLPELSELENDTLLYLHDGSYNSRSLLAIDSESSFSGSGNDPDVFRKAQAWIDEQNDHIMVAISYDLKNSIETLHTRHPDRISFPDLFLFVPRLLAAIEKGEIDWIKGGDAAEKQKIESLLLASPQEVRPTGAVLKPRIERAVYLNELEKVLRHIQRGDIYEMNYCQEFYLENQEIHPFSTYRRLHELTQAPFSVFFRHQNSYLLCGSPERYLKKEGSKLISQPIKGTVRRGTTPEEDAELIAHLSNDEKERAENIMITDLVRNDMSRSALPGTVQVEELCGIYTFKTVHQMISTVTSELSEETTFTQLLKDTFPMGSMTGAPKVSAMQIIDTLEHSRRGLYSGSVGYLSPEGDFDLNVVIRSLLYNSESHYLSAMVGGAITALSNPEKEYEECLLKADALFKALC